MQVEINYVKFRNLMSYGNVDTHVDLNTHKHTLITAKNAQGKSSIIEAIFYGLYGKPYRSIKVGQLINSINKKALVVEVGIRTCGKQYKVIRGQKPAIFQIYEDGALIQEDAASRDYQQLLETKILGINQRSFRQIVCIGSASYKPFMDLVASDRRAITEEVLDISIFTSMQDIAKRRVLELKSSTDALSSELTMLKAQISSNKTLLDQLQAEKVERDAVSSTKRSELDSALAQHRMVLEELKTSLQQLNAADVSSRLQRTRNALNQARSKLGTEQYKLTQHTHALSHTDDDICPTCTQKFPLERRQALIESSTAQHTKCAADISALNTIIYEMEQREAELSAVDAQCREVSIKIIERESLIRSIKKQIDDMITTDSGVTIQLCKSTIHQLAASVIDKTNEKNDHTKNLLYYRTAVDLLKDDGVKSRVIATFIPLMNEFINDYLKKFDMFIKFELDEFFNEHILSRGRDSFTYNSFSQGEKQKIDIAILMAWRKVAMMRSSVACNLLLFDETMDSSLDAESIDIFVDVLNGVEDGVNSIVISHRATVVPEIFDRHLTVSKVRDFSVIAEM